MQEVTGSPESFWDGILHIKKPLHFLVGAFLFANVITCKCANGLSAVFADVGLLVY